MYFMMTILPKLLISKSVIKMLPLKLHVAKMSPILLSRFSLKDSGIRNFGFVMLHF